MADIEVRAVFGHSPASFDCHQAPGAALGLTSVSGLLGLALRLDPACANVCSRADPDVQNPAVHRTARNPSSVIAEPRPRCARPRDRQVASRPVPQVCHIAGALEGEGCESMTMLSTRRRASIYGRLGVEGRYHQSRQEVLARERDVSSPPGSARETAACWQ